MDCSPPGSSVHGILQARTLQWVAMPSSRRSSRPKDQTQVSCIAGGFFPVWATREAQHTLKLPFKGLRRNWRQSFRNQWQTESHCKMLSILQCLGRHSVASEPPLRMKIGTETNRAFKVTPLCPWSWLCHWQRLFRCISMLKRLRDVQVNMFGSFYFYSPAWINEKEPVNSSGLRMRRGFPASLLAQMVEHPLEVRRPGFDLWVGKVTWRGEWLPTPYSCLENSTDRGAWWATLQSLGLQRIGHAWVIKYTEAQE